MMHRFEELSGGYGGRAAMRTDCGVGRRAAVVNHSLADYDEQPEFLSNLQDGPQSWTVQTGRRAQFASRGDRS